MNARVLLEAIALAGLLLLAWLLFTAAPLVVCALVWGCAIALYGARFVQRKAFAAHRAPRGTDRFLQSGENPMRFTKTTNVPTAIPGVHYLDCPFMPVAEPIEPSTADALAADCTWCESYDAMTAAALMREVVLT